MLAPGAVMALQQALSAWFEQHGRAFPWRTSTRSAYRVWISEIMLQQTRGEQALPYYRRFMEQFPTLARLAAADQQDVLKAWEGLGYYSRARNMHMAAQQIVREQGGHFPETYEGLLALPGVGPYTAAAVGSVVYGLPRAVVDGNVVRVVARLFRVEDIFQTSAGKKRFQMLADSLLCREAPGRHNEAMMELGALLCVPRGPRCEWCPVSAYCEACAAQVQEEYPRRRHKKKIPHIQVGAGVISNSRGYILIAQRRAGDMLGGLWEFPGGKLEADETLEECVARELLEELGIVVQIDAHYITVRHTYSHFSMDLHAYRGRLQSGNAQALECAAFKWVPLHALTGYPMSRADDKIRDRILSEAALFCG